MQNASRIALAIVSGATSLMASACGAQASLCEASIKAKLLNPETLEFKDFAPASDEQAKALLGEILGENASRFADMDVVLKGAKDRKPNSEMFTARVRAEGRLGNTITEQNLCFADAQSCECVGSL